MAIEIWNHESGPFRPNVAVLTIVCHIGTAISPWGKGLSKNERTIIVAYDKGMKAIELRNLLLWLIRGYSTFGAIHDPPLLHRMLLSAPSVCSSPR